MAERARKKRTYRKLVKREVVVERDGVIRFLKAFGFEATGDPNLFRREEARKTHQRKAGARYYQTVNVEDLEADPEGFRRFVGGLCRRHPDIVKKLDEENARLPKPKRGEKG